MPASITASEIKDTQWISQAFFNPKRYGGAGQQVDSTYTSADMKFYDTTPGGNKSINPKYQFTRSVDLRRPSLAAASKGMGGYYSGAYDDHATRISLRFGKPRTNPLSRFLSGYFDRSLAHVVNTGESSPGIFSCYSIGKALATIYTLPLQAYFGLVYLYNRVTSAVTGRPYSKFYYMEPTMALYWSTVNTLVNKMAVSLGLSHGYTPDDLGGIKDGTDAGATVAPTEGPSADDLTVLNKILPDIFRSDSESVIDVRSMAGRAQRLQNSYYETLSKIAKNTSLDYDSYVAAVQNALRTNSLSSQETNLSDLQTYLNAYSASPTGKNTGGGYVVPEENAEATVDPTSLQNTAVRSEEPSLKDYLYSELREGSAFVTFDVDYNGSIGESFSSSTKDIGLKDQINDAASKMRDNWINFANGNVGDGLIGGAVETVLSSVKSLVAGAASAVGFGGLASLGGAAFVDTPEVWDNATADLPSESYTMTLSTPYGNKMSIFLDIIIPLCCLLAGALPQATGKASYGSPYLVSLHSQGRSDIGLGIIDSLQIERGTSNVGWNVDGLPTAVNVTFSVKNLNSVMYTPISDSLTKSLFSFSHFDEDSALTSYINTLCAVDLYDQFYAGPRLKMAWNKTTADWDSLFSASSMAQFAASSAPGQLVSAILSASPSLKGL